MARKCCEKMKGRRRQDRFGRGKRVNNLDRKLGIAEMKRSREEGEAWFRKVVQADRNRQRKERWKRINESR